MSMLKFSKNDKASLGMVLLSSCSIGLNLYNYVKINGIKKQRINDHKRIDFLQERLSLYETSNSEMDELLRDADFNTKNMQRKQLEEELLKCKILGKQLSKEKDGLNNKIQDLIQSVKDLTGQKVNTYSFQMHILTSSSCWLMFILLG